MSLGWVALIIGCVFALALLFAVAMGCAAKRGDRQNRRAAQHARERVVVTQDFWPRGELAAIQDVMEGRLRPFDQDDEFGFNDPPAGYGGA